MMRCIDCGYEGDGQELARYTEDNKVVFQCSKCAGFNIKRVSKLTLSGTRMIEEYKKSLAVGNEVRKEK